MLSAPTCAQNWWGANCGCSWQQAGEWYQLLASVAGRQSQGYRIFPDCEVFFW